MSDSIRSARIKDGFFGVLERELRPALARERVLVASWALARAAIPSATPAAAPPSWLTALVLHRRGALLPRHLVAAVRADAAGMRRDRAEADPELLRGVLRAPTGRQLDDDRFLHHVRALRRRAARGAARAAHTRRNVERLTDLR